MTKERTKKAAPRRTSKRNISATRASSDSTDLHINEALHGDKDEPMPRGEAVCMVLGILMLALAAFTLLSFVSFLMTGAEDQKTLQAGYLGGTKNWTGYLGAWWSDFWINSKFGFGAFLMPVFFFATAIRLTKAYRIRLWKWFINCTFLLCWVSVASDFFLRESFQNSHIIPGGGHGRGVVDFLSHFGGSVGVFIILALLLIGYLSYLGVEVISLIQHLMHPKELAHDVYQRMPFVQWLKRRWNKPDNIEASPEEEEEENEENIEEEEIVDEPKKSLKPTSATEEEEKEEEASIEEEAPITIDLTNISYVPDDKEDNKDDKNEDHQLSTTDIPLDIIAPTGDDQPLDTDFVITEPVEEPLADEERLAALEPYDPKLDLENYQYPTLDLLKHYDIDPRAAIDMDEQTKNKDQIVNVLSNFGVKISSISATVGPTITLYEIVPAPGVRITRIRNLEDDIALALSALGIRIIAPIPGKGTIGIEVPNAKPQIVSMESIINSKKFQETTMELPMALGKTITNEVYMADLAKMPHLLVAGATGQGKSVGLNAIITSLLYKKHPAELKLVMVDPKKVEFSVYAPIVNHFLAQIEDENGEEPIITDVQKVINTLKSLCVEMDTRYDLLKKARARNIKEYNEKFRNRQLNPEKGHHFLPYIVVIIDEFGDLIMTAGKEIELPIARIAQLARAVGMHMVIATQRPTTNIITGTIKANFPARMAFKVSAMVDSRTILDRPGANQLVGKGDMLFLAGTEPVRIQCAFVDTPEVEKIANFIACQQSYTGPFGLPRPPMEDAGSSANDADLNNLDPMFAEAARLIVNSQQGSTSMIQRKFAIGYNRAGRLMDQLEKAGVVGQAQGSKPREVLIQDEVSLEMLLSNLG